MNKLIKNAIEEGFADYQDSDMWNMTTNERDVYTLGWKEGAEWILTELNLKYEITSATVKKYMDCLYER